MLGRLTIILLCLAALAGCSRPTSIRPEISAERAKEEAIIQRQLAATQAGPRGRHHSRNRETSTFDQDLADLARLATVGWAIAEGAAPLCGDAVSPEIGATLATLGDLPPPIRGFYRERFHFFDEAAVLAVAEASPAAAAGLAVGDVILAVDGAPVAKGGDAARRVEAALAGPVELRVRRDGVEMDLAMRPRSVCASRLELARSATVNAFADGRTIFVTVAMMRTLEDDDELAVIIGHEMAHNVLEHIAKQQENVKTGATFGGLLNMLTGARHLQNHWANVGGRAFSQSFEAEADYVGLYYAAAGGFNVGEAPGVWRKMAVANPATIAHASTHPTSPARFVMLEETVREIAAKRARGAPLKPEFRGK